MIEGIPINKVVKRPSVQSSSIQNIPYSTTFTMSLNVDDAYAQNISMIWMDLMSQRKMRWMGLEFQRKKMHPDSPLKRFAEPQP